jgi:hypothetical protein
MGRSFKEVAARVSAMSAAEVTDRLRQETDKRLDVLRYQFTTNNTQLRKSSQLRLSTGKFFFDSQDIPEVLDALRNRLPNQVNAIVAEAEQICAHRFRLLGYEDIQYGPVIDWHLDAVHQKSSPRKPWFKINYFDAQEVGDPKITWELNRHQHLVILAKAFRLTGERRFAEELFAQWYSWQEQNPYPIGINWASSLEVAFRGLSWLWVASLLEGTDVVPANFPSDMAHALSTAGHHIERYLSTYTSPNTHLLGEAVGMFFIGTLCPTLPRARHWQQKGWQIILEEARNQVRPDGFHFEQSTYYHVYALDLFVHARLLAARNGVAIPDWLDDTLLRMMNVLRTLGQAGAAPAFGDDDGGRVFDSNRNRREHFFDPLAIGAVAFGRSDFKQTARTPTEEALWLLGPDAAGRFDSIPDEPTPMRSVALADSGAYVMVNSRGEQLVIDAGPQGTHTAGHGHADALSIHLSADGREILSDPGTFQYSGEGRRQFRSTAAHNTLQVDGFDQADPKTPFSWGPLPTTKVERWITGREFDVFCASHDGYKRLQDPVIHHRWVINFKTGVWLVRDALQGMDEHDIDIAWHLPPGASPDNPGNIAYDPTSGLAIITAPEQPWTATIRDDSWSPVYGPQVPSKTLHHTIRRAMPVEFGTALASADSRAELGLLHVSGIGPARADYNYCTPSAEHRVIFAGHSHPWSADDLASDADLLCCVLRNQQVQALLFCNGTYAEYRGHRVVSTRQPVSWCELVRRGPTFDIHFPGREFLNLDPGSDMPEPAVATRGTSERMGS